MASTSQRYPLSTPDGMPIPLEIMKPHSFLSKTFLTSASTAAITVPADVEIMSITCSEDCIIVFGATATLPVDGVAIPDAVVVDQWLRVCVAPKASTFYIRGLSADGEARIQFIEKWAGLAVQTQYTKR